MILGMIISGITIALIKGWLLTLVVFGAFIILFLGNYFYIQITIAKE